VRSCWYMIHGKLFGNFHLSVLLNLCILDSFQDTEIKFSGRRYLNLDYDNVP